MKKHIELEKKKVEQIKRFNVDVNKQTITFLHKDKKYFFRWEDIKDNITGLSSIIIAYATSYEDFEKLMNIYSPTLC